MGQMFAADAKAHNDQVVFKSAGVLVVFGLGQHVLVAFARHHIGKTGRNGHKARRKHHGEHAYSKKCLVGVHVKKLGAQARSRQHKGKFTHLRQRKRGYDGCSQGVALHQYRRQGEQAFDNYKERRYDKNAHKMLRKIFQIQHHAHRNEKQAHEDVTVGQNTRNNAHAVL